MGKRIIKVDEIGYRHLLKAIREYRNKLIESNKNSPSVDDLFLKVMKAKDVKER